MDLANLVLIAVGSALVSNVVLSQFLGICSFLGVSKKIETSVGMGGAVIFVITLASLVAGLLHQFILQPLGFDYLNTIGFILVSAALVQIVEMFLKKFVPSLYSALGVYLPLITTNCAVLGVALNNVQYGYNVLQSTINGFGTSFGFTISIVILAGIADDDRRHRDFVTCSPRSLCALFGDILIFICIFQFGMKALI